jgi:Ca-activated chloride channel family protein
MRFLHPQAFALLLAAPALWWLIARGLRLRTIALRGLSGAEAKTRPRLPLFAALVLLIAGIAQPGSPRPADAPGLDIVFLIDVSRSMSTRDVVPSRIGQARALARDVMSHAASERFGLVVFAGNAGLECPLTNDYSFVRDQLKGAWRESVTLGGTRIGDALRFAARFAFDDASRNARELVLITDGGDQEGDQENDGENNNQAGALADLTARKIRLVTVGVGDSVAGGLLPKSEIDPAPFLYNGKQVSTKLDSAALSSLCAAYPGCVYADAHDPSLSRVILRKFRADADAVPLAAALLALAAALLLTGEQLLL